MSGKPNPEGVETVIRLLDEIAELDAEIAELKPKADRLRSAEVARSNVQTSLANALKGMDLESRGNHGFEARLAWFLSEMRRQAARPAQGGESE